MVYTPVCSETCGKIRWREVYSEVFVIISSLQPQGVTAVHTQIPKLQTSWLQLSHPLAIKHRLHNSDPI